jgi:predicted phage-related endonuclease
MKRIDCEQGSPQWFAARAGIATASCFADVLATIKSGEAAVRRNYRAKLVVERLTGKVVEGFQSSAMKQGTEREPLARAAYESRTGAFVDEVGFIRHDEIECGGSPDGLIDDDGLLEIKAPEIAAHLMNLRAKRIPPEYVPQVQGCLWLTGRKWADFVSFSPDFPEPMQLLIVRVERDDKYIAGLQLAISLFMDEVRTETEELSRQYA